MHHKHYETFGREILSDVEALCSGCHGQADAKRRDANIQRYISAGEAARKEAAKRTYFDKKYAHLEEDAQLGYLADFENNDQEFERWWEKKQEEEDYEE